MEDEVTCVPPWSVRLAVWCYFLPSLLAFSLLIAWNGAPGMGEFFWGAQVPSLILAFGATASINSGRQRLRPAAMSLPLAGGVALVAFLVRPYVPYFSPDGPEALLFDLYMTAIAQVFTLPGALLLLLPPSARWYRVRAALPVTPVGPARRFW